MSSQAFFSQAFIDIAKYAENSVMYGYALAGLSPLVALPENELPLYPTDADIHEWPDARYLESLSYQSSLAIFHSFYESMSQIENDGGITMYILNWQNQHPGEVFGFSESSSPFDRMIASSVVAELMQQDPPFKISPIGEVPDTANGERSIADWMVDPIMYEKLEYFYNSNLDNFNILKGFDNQDFVFSYELIKPGMPFEGLNGFKNANSIERAFDINNISEGMQIAGSIIEGGVEQFMKEVKSIEPMCFAGLVESSPFCGPSR